jgi:hypothetical protein
VTSWDRPLFTPGAYGKQQAFSTANLRFQGLGEREFKPLFDQARIYKDSPPRFTLEFPKMRTVDEFTRFALSPLLSNEN